MVKYVWMFIIALACVCAYYKSKCDYQKKEIELLLKQKEECYNELEANRKASERAEKTIGEIRTVIKTVPSVCDCYNSAIEPDIIKLLRNKK